MGLSVGARTSVLSTSATLNDAALASGDYDNSTDLRGFCHAYLTVQYATAPSAGTMVADLYALFGDGAGSETFPEGGASLRPQRSLWVGGFEARDPSNSATEQLIIPHIPLGPATTRFVIENISGQQFAAGWTLAIVPFDLTA